MTTPENGTQNPNADMSLREQFAQAAYGRTVDAVMSDPERDFSEIVTAAISANMDIIYGEHHMYIDETMNQMISAINNAPENRIKAVTLELPTEMQTLFEPDTFHSMDERQFAIQVSMTMRNSLLLEAERMIENGEISEDQFIAVSHHIDNIAAQELELLGDPGFNIEATVPAAIQRMAAVAIEKGIPVIANDVDRQRGVAAYMSMLDDETLRFSSEQVSQYLAAGVDDRSDIEHLETMGVDIQGDGVILAHRGFLHIDNTYANGAHEYGYDEILESKGRSVLTVGILPQEMHYTSPDNADFYILSDNLGEKSRVNRIMYMTPEESQQVVEDFVVDFNPDEDSGLVDPNETLEADADFEPAEPYAPQTPPAGSPFKP